MTPCDYAACARPATTAEDGWRFCPGHLAEHRAEHRDQRIAELHALGASDPQIAVNVDCDKSTVRAVRIRLGLAPTERRGPRRSYDRDVQDLHALGWTDRDMADALGTWPSSIVRVRNRLALPVNPAPARGGPPPTRPCGTPAAAKRHRRRGEPVCEPCRQALAADRLARKGRSTYPSTQARRWSA